MKKKSFLAYPYVIWSAIFIVIPLILVVLFSFTKEVDGKQIFSISDKLSAALRQKRTDASDNASVPL